MNNVKANARNVIKPNSVTTNTLGAFFKGRTFGRLRRR